MKIQATSIGAIVVSFLLAGAGSITWTSCSNKTDRQNERPAEPQAAIDSGEMLSRTYCGSCHLYPPPELLDKKSWREGVLPVMGRRFGIYADVPRDSLIENGIAGRIVNEAAIYPTRQIISDRHWQLIRQYYLRHAPDTLPSGPGSASYPAVTTFTPIVPEFAVSHPAISAIHYDGQAGKIFLADCSRQGHSSIIILDAKFRPLTTLGLPHPVSHMAVRSDTLMLLVMGHFIPSDEPAGSLIRALRDDGGMKYKGYTLALKYLKRPVDAAYGDIDRDGDEDIVVCEFGNHTGSVSVFIKNGKKYRKQVLNKAPGAVRVMMEDMNGDALPDLVVLMGQGDEGIDLYLNRGAGQFVKQRVLRFPAVYGSVSFSLVDMNGDGHKDIVYVNGDNADFSPVLKPYHGVRIFINDRHNRFTESYFFPQHGAYKAIARDFDLDGDVDIASISFFPDFRQQPEESFVYLRNDSAGDSLAFTAHTFPGAGKGRWITMEAADLDKDGDDDLILGSFTGMGIPGDTTGAIMQEIIDRGSPVVWLRNTAKP